VSAARIDAPAWAEPVWAIEVRLRPLPTSSARAYEPLPAFPGVERDLALLIPDDVQASRVGALLREHGGELLEEVAVFDLYAGKGVPEGTRSVAWRLRFRHPERTLTDAEVESVVTNQLRALEEELGVKRR
jgi:phenylalanyl-tRNA synthetase beta chain